MAKKINDPENPAPENKEVETTLPEPVPEENAPAPVPEENKPPRETKKAKEEAAVPEYADGILKTHSAYPQLYIDPHGGTYTVDTPPVFRSSATLYHNPYYKP